MPARHTAVVVLLGCLLAGCTSGGSAAAPTAATSRPPSRSPLSSSRRPGSTSPATPSTSAAPSSAAQRALDAMSLRERVGQLLMVDCPTSGLASATSSAITDEHVGSVILDGTSTAGRPAISSLTGQLQGLAPKQVGLLVATDQEGGEVQRLQGPGFDTIPSGVAQGRLDPTTLRSDAHRWGGQLRRAGVNVDLAPVLDTVPSDQGSNPPIGDLDREYGSTPSAVSTHGVAFARGLAAAGVDATGKHFPGLGRVDTNTDTTRYTSDDVTTRHDADLAPFRAAVRAGIPFMMVSSAIYTRIDPGAQAAFSPTVVTGMLRGDLGFRGVIISDDLGAAAAVTRDAPGERAVRFVDAGGDLVLTVVASDAGPMTDALYRMARADKSFRAKVDAAALTVLQAKQARGLLR